MNKGFKLIVATGLLTAIAFPAAVSAKPEAKPEMFSATKWMIAGKPEAKPEMAFGANAGRLIAGKPEAKPEA
ncbi:UNVERIFIED_CONTAM: hypothetical protein ABID98_005690 [Brevibacillus sp. OAP136]